MIYEAWPSTSSITRSLDLYFMNIAYSLQAIRSILYPGVQATAAIEMLSLVRTKHWPSRASYTRLELHADVFNASTATDTWSPSSQQTTDHSPDPNSDTPSADGASVAPVRRGSSRVNDPVSCVLLVLVLESRLRSRRERERDCRRSGRRCRSGVP